MQKLKLLGQVCAVLGAQWGDEGKGKLIDILAEEYDIIVRATGGANAGHTIYLNKKQKYVFHLVPSGMFHRGKICVMGNGMVIHFPALFEEIKVLKKLGVKIKGRLFLAQNAHIVFEYHKLLDKIQEEIKGQKKVGTTMRGIGPAYADKISRIGIRVCELADFKSFESHVKSNIALLKKMYGFSYNPKKELKFFRKNQKKILNLTKNTVSYFAELLAKKKRILLEGANGTLLDIDHGTYPYVTSSNASIGGIISGSGIPASFLKNVIGIAKAYTTRVGAGPFPTELKNKLGDFIRDKGREYGSTTGRPRRCGFFDAVIVKHSIMLNGIDSLNLTKLDVLSGLSKIKICTAYKYKGKLLETFPADFGVFSQCEPIYTEVNGWNEDISKARKFSDLPKNCRNYVLKLEQILKTPINFIGVGVTKNQMIFRIS